MLIFPSLRTNMHIIILKLRTIINRQIRVISPPTMPLPSAAFLVFLAAPAQARLIAPDFIGFCLGDRLTMEISILQETAFRGFFETGPPLHLSDRVFDQRVSSITLQLCQSRLFPQ